MRIAALIPCRSGSKGIPGKNFKELHGKPLWKWTYQAAKESGVFETIIVSRDADRPEELCNDSASLDDVLWFYAQKHPDIDAWCLLQPTSPLRTDRDIRDASYLIEDYDSVVSVTSVGDKYWMKIPSDIISLYNPECRLNRQDPKTDVLLYENGAIYFCRRWLLDEKTCRIGGRVGFYQMPEERSYQIDTPFDWKVVECALS